MFFAFISKLIALLMIKGKNTHALLGAAAAASQKLDAICGVCPQDHAPDVFNNFCNTILSDMKNAYILKPSCPRTYAALGQTREI